MPRHRQFGALGRHVHAMEFVKLALKSWVKQAKSAAKIQYIQTSEIREVCLWAKRRIC